jgi:hypothetical protein
MEGIFSFACAKVAEKEMAIAVKRKARRFMERVLRKTPQGRNR